MVGAAAAIPSAETAGRRFWPLALASILLVVLALWLAAYFWINSAPGRAQVQSWLSDRAPDDRVQVAAIQWGPAPNRIELLGARVLDADGDGLIVAQHVVGHVALSTIFGGDMRFDSLTVDGFAVHLAWDAEGHFNIADALKKPKDPDKPDTPKSAKRPWDLGQIELRRGRVTLTWPRWELSFDAVGAAGTVRQSADDGLIIGADLKGGESLFVHGSRRVRYDSVDIGGFAWKAEGFTTEQLVLRGEAALADVRGKMRFGSEVSADVRGEVRLSAAHAQALLPGWFPAGASGEGLHIQLAGGALTGSVGRATAPEVTAGPVQVSGVDVPIEALHFVPGVLKPQGSLRIVGAKAARVQTATGLTASDVRFGSLALTVRAAAQADFEDISAATLRLPEGEIGAAKAQGSISLGVKSGQISGTLETPQGTVGVSGKIKVNPFTRKVKVAVKVAFEGVVKQLAMNLTKALPDDVKAALGASIDGFATFEVRVGRKTDDGGKKHWTVTSEITDAHLTGSEQVVVFDGDTWTQNAATSNSP